MCQCSSEYKASIRPFCGRRICKQRKMCSDVAMWQRRRRSLTCCRLTVSSFDQVPSPRKSVHKSVQSHSMKAIVYKTFGAPDVLKLVNHPLPQRSAGELLVKVKSTSVNPVDYKTRNGSIPIAKKNKVMPSQNINSPAHVPGLSYVSACMQILGGDLAGVIESADADSKVRT